MLEATSRPKDLEACLNEIYFTWRNALRAQGSRNALPVTLLQAAHIQAMMDYFDVPNRYDHVDEIHRKRLELLARTSEKYCIGLEKLIALLRDPLNEAPPESARVLG